MDKDVVARVLDGDLRYITDPTAVVAVAQSSCLIAGVTFGDDDAKRLTVACAYVATLVHAARDADRRAPDRVPAIRTTQVQQRGRPPAHASAAAGMSLAIIDTPVTTRRRRPATIAAGLVVVLVVTVIGAIISISGHSLPSLAARSGRDARDLGATGTTTTTAPPTESPDCYKDVPPAGTDLLDVPHRHPHDATNPKMNDWWPNNDHIEMDAYGLRNFEATVRTGRTNIWDLVIVRSCLPYSTIASTGSR